MPIPKGHPNISKWSSGVLLILMKVSMGAGASKNGGEAAIFCELVKILICHRVSKYLEFRFWKNIYPRKYFIHGFRLHEGYFLKAGEPFFLP